MQEFKKSLKTLESFIRHRPNRHNPLHSRDLVPLLEELKKEIKEENKALHKDESYFKRIYQMTTNYMIESDYAKVAHQEKSVLMNTTVTLQWLAGYFQKMHKHVYGIQDDVNKKIEEYKKIAEDYNVDIEKDIESIKNHLKEYESSYIYKNFDNETNTKTAVLDALRFYLIDLDKKSFERGLKDRKYSNAFIGQNYPTDFRKSPELAEMVNLLDNIKEEFKDYYGVPKRIVDDSSIINLIDKSDNDFKNMYSKLRAAGYKSCMANIHEENLKDKSILGFLKTKEEEPSQTVTNEELPEWSKLSKITLFKDHSLLLVDKSNQIKEVVSVEDAKIIKKSLIQEYIQKEFSRKPTIGKIFKNMNAKVDIDEIASLERVINTYLKNEGILKLYEFDIAKTFQNAIDTQTSVYRIFENFDDNMCKIIHKHKVKKFIHNIASNKYDHLYNDETYKLANEIYDLNLPDNSLQEYIGKKLAAFKTPEQFNDALGLFLESLNSFTMAATLNKAKTYGVDVISENDNKLLLRIDNFNQSKVMGSSAWCISRTESYFNSYAEDREQYFLYDFSKDTTDSTSLIGVTLEVNGDYSVACYKDDTECEEDEPLVSYVQEEVFEYKSNMEAAYKNKLKI